MYTFFLPFESSGPLKTENPLFLCTLSAAESLGLNRFSINPCRCCRHCFWDTTQHWLLREDSLENITWKRVSFRINSICSLPHILYSKWFPKNSFIETITRKIKDASESTSNYHVHLKARKGNTGSTLLNTNMRLLKIRSETRADQNTQLSLGQNAFEIKLNFLFLRSRSRVCFVGAPQSTVIWFQPEQAPQTDTGRQVSTGVAEQVSFHFLPSPRSADPATEK